MRLVRISEHMDYLRRCRSLRIRGLSEGLYRDVVDAGDWDLMESLEKVPADELERLAGLVVVPSRPDPRRLLEECDRADALAGDRGGFVETKRIRQLLGGGS